MEFSKPILFLTITIALASPITSISPASQSLSISPASQSLSISPAAQPPLSHTTNTVNEMKSSLWQSLDVDSKEVNPAVSHVCAGTDYTNECISAVLPLLESKHADVSPVDVLKLEMKSLSTKTDETMEIAKHLKKTTPSGTVTVDSANLVFDTCLENYASLVDDLKDAQEAVDAHDFGRLQSMLSATLGDVSSCTDAFAEFPGLTDPMADVDEFLRKLCVNVLATSQMIHI